MWILIFVFALKVNGVAPETPPIHEYPTYELCHEAADMLADQHIFEGKFECRPK